MKLKLGCQIEFHRHRSALHFMANLLAGLLPYSFDPSKPEIGALACQKLSWLIDGWGCIRT